MPTSRFWSAILHHELQNDSKASGLGLAEDYLCITISSRYSPWPPSGTLISKTFQYNTLTLFSSTIILLRRPSTSYLLFNDMKCLEAEAVIRANGLVY